MRKIKKVSLILLTLLMGMSNFNVQIFAEDGTTPKEESTYSATYEFVLDEEGKLPKEVITLLPETKEDLKQGDVLTNDIFENVETDESVYSFKEWNYKEYTIEDSDVHFVGTWHKETKATEKEDPKEEESTNEENNSNGSIEVKFQFIEFGGLLEGNLPQEVLDILPRCQYVDSVDQIDLPKFEDLVAGYKFLWWDIASINNDGNEYFVAYGAWQKLLLRYIPSVGNPGYEGAVKVVGAGDATAGVYDIRKGRMSNMAIENIVGGSYVYCVEPDKTAFVGTAPTSFYDISLGYGTGVHFSRRMKEIIGIGQLKGASYGEIQAALWNYITGGINYTSGTHYDPDSSFYENDGRYSCWGTAYESYIDPATGKEMQSVAEAGCEIVPTKGKVTLKKSAASTSFNYVANCPNNYSLKGAEYGVYSDQACTKKVGTLTTDASGNTNSIELDAGTYYVKEIKASPGFKLDTNVYTARVNVDQTFTVQSTEQPVDDPTYIVLTKQSAREGYNNEYLDQAEFTIKYYDAQTDNPSGNPKYTWVFKPIIENGKAIVRLDQAHFVRGDALILGSGTNIRIPLGTFTIEETKAPETFARDTKVYVGHITYKNNKVETVINGGGWLKVENQQLTQTEEPQTVTIAVQKLDSDTNKAEAQGIATLKGAEFTVKKLNPETNKKETVGKIVTDDKGYGKLEKDTKGLKLLPGTYYVQETKAPNGYVVNKEEFTIEAKIKEPNTANFDYKISIKDKVTQIKVLKVDSNGNEIASAELQLLDETGKVVYSWVSDGTPHIIKGLTIDHKYTLHEATVKPNYMIAEDKPVTVKDETSKDYVMVDQDIKIHTTASFKESNSKNYVADGVARILDEVEYENLYAGRNYVLKGELMDKQTNTSLLEVEHPFTPNKKNGRTVMEFEFNLDDYDNHDFVVFETLYILDEQGNKTEVTDHKDINDEGQTVHVDELYRADLIIYKVDGETKEPLDGVEFEVSYSRTKADGSLEEKSLGTFTSENGKIELPKMKKDSKVTVKELSAPEGYYIYPEPFIFNIGHDESVKVIEHTIENHQVKIGTSAKFKESNSKNYVADGVAHIIDTVSYEWLYEGKEYIVKGKLIDLGTKDDPKQEEVTVSSKKFTPKKTHGTVEVEFTFNFDGFDEHSFVVFEELFILEDGKEIPVTDHKDPEDKNQTVYTDKLYRAEMVLYKVNGKDKNIKLSGAYFNVTTSRVKRDGTKVEKDLGTFVTGGICAEADKEFTLIVAKDEAMNDVVKAYNSSYENRLKKHLAVALDLEDGIYYGKTNIEGSKVIKYQVEKGAIILPDQPEDTEISYKEVIAPSGYYLNVDPYIVTVGHDYSLSRIENYRTNNMIVVIPKTGIE